MNKFKNHILMASGFALLAAVVAGVTAGPVIAQAVKAALVKNVDERGRVPYQQEVGCQAAPANPTCLGVGPQVPNGKRLVVEHVSTSISLQTGFHITDVFLSSSSFVLGISPATYVHPLFQSTSAGNDAYNQNESVVQYFEAGDRPTINLDRDGGSVFMVGLISGYLVDLGI